ncbi:MAG: hypothetical protein CL439_08105 [Acidimicrobiaceae bacterium]|nr:hypothetical protein [Acidimicrobiaceae bacterium]
MFRKQADEAKEQGYSLAFDNIVQDEDDVVGLLAYALYKRAVREDAEAGRATLGHKRNPSPTVVETYRSAAERRLSEVIEASIDEARPELQISAALDAIGTAKSDLREHVTRRTNWLPQLVTNVVAWAFTLLVATLLFAALDRPSPAEVVADRAADAVRPAPPPAPTQ